MIGGLILVLITSTHIINDLHPIVKLKTALKGGFLF